MGETPSVVRTKSLTLGVNRQQPHLMPKNIDVEGGEFGLPNDLPFLQQETFDITSGVVSFVDSSVSVSD